MNIRRHWNLFKNAPIAYLYSFTKSATEKVRVFPYDPASKDLAERYISLIQSVVSAPVYFVGSASLELPGQKDIDLLISCKRSELSTLLESLIPILGQPSKVRPEFAE